MAESSNGARLHGKPDPRILPAALLILLACQFSPATPVPTPAARTRQEAIPSDAMKGTPANDSWPPVAAEGWSVPEPLDGPINTAGGEDSPFLAGNDRAFYFFFTPDVNNPAQESIFDGLTGIWVSRLGPDGWEEPERVPLGASGEIHLDGCEFVLGDRMYFCSVRTGNRREIDWWIATLQDGIWGDIRNGGDWLNGDGEIGELCITAGYRELYFGSGRSGGYGGSDLWVAPASPDGWGEPVNLGPRVNTMADESRPFVTDDGRELWYTLHPSRLGKPGPSVARCLRQADGSWDDCSEIVSSFAGEPTLSSDGNTLYFIHHFYSADMTRMIEADIYVSHRWTDRN
jgi:hypothetical protein